MIKKVFCLLSYQLKKGLVFIKKAFRFAFKRIYVFYKRIIRNIIKGLKKVGIIKNVNFYISTSDLYYLQNHQTYTNDITDSVVRYLAIEDYYNKNNYGFKIYNEMQLKRVNENWEIRFKGLINSFETKYDSNYPIKLRENYNIADGSHRFALAIYHNIDYVKVELEKYIKGKRNYSIDWFYENDFNLEMINVIKEKNKLIEQRLKYDFIAILWPPAEPFFDEIINDIDSLEGINIIKHRNLSLVDHYDFVRAIYKTDDISKENVEKKIAYMKNSTLSDRLNIKILYLDISFPHHRIKKQTKQPQSLTTMKIKKIIRSRYKNKIEHYYHDVLIHISDNFYQSKVSAYLIDMSRNMSFLFDELSSDNYVLIKNNDIKDKPLSFKLKTDYDILVNHFDLVRIFNKVSDLMQIRFQDSNFQFKKISNPSEFQYRVELNGFLILQIHLQSKFDFIEPNTISKLIDQGKGDFFKYLPLKYDLIIRLVAYFSNKNKIHHLKFIKAHLDYLDYDLINEFTYLNISSENIDRELKNVL